VNKIVLDTNIVLDLYVFKDPATIPLKTALQSGTHQWIATQPMRDELARVLAYPQIAPRLAFYQLTAPDVLAQFDKFAQLNPVAPKASVTCKDADDQKFIDLAVAYKSVLLSKDNAVLCMAKRLTALDVDVNTQLKVPIVLP
jgi:putative PIN family toxin of toxin-antitoxin system